MRSQGWMFFAAMLVVLSACSDQGTRPVSALDESATGAIALSIPKNETPSDVWVIEARLERQGYPPRKESAFVHAALDTVRITITDVPAGVWNITVDAKDSAGHVRYTGGSSALIIDGQTVQAYVQMNPVGGTGSLEIIVAWQSGSPQLRIRTAGDFFLVQQPIPVAITNISHVTLITVTCCARPDLRIQRKLDGSWSPAGECELMCPSILLPLKPGETLVDTVWRVLQPGVYRLLLRYSDPRRATARPFETYSNEFKVISARTDSVKIGEAFGLKFGEHVTLQGTDLTLALRDVTEDSRCPEGVVCVWEGNARIVLDVNQTAIALNTTLEPKQVSYSAFVIRQLSLYPYPKFGHEISKEEYVAILIVTGRR